MFTLKATVTYEDDGGGVHVEEYCYRATSITDGVNYLQEKIDRMEERRHWTAVDVNIYRVELSDCSDAEI